MRDASQNASSLMGIRLIDPPPGRYPRRRVLRPPADESEPLLRLLFTG